MTPDGIPHCVQVFGHLRTGEIVGEMSFLLGTPASANVVAEDDRCSAIRLPKAHLTRLFADRPDIASTFYCFLATRAAERGGAAVAPPWLNIIPWPAMGTRFGPNSIIPQPSQSGPVHYYIF